LAKALRVFTQMHSTRLHIPYVSGRRHAFARTPPALPQRQIALQSDVVITALNDGFKPAAFALNVLHSMRYVHTGFSSAFLPFAGDFL
jgi:hypothetical protein